MRFVRAGFPGVLAAAVTLAPAHADERIYANFPVTVPGYSGTATDSVSYRGQIARQVLHDSLKKLASQGNGKPNPELRARMTVYYSGKDKGRAIVAPLSKGGFRIEQTVVDQVGAGANLADKTYKGAVSGMPNNMTGPELVKFWIDKAASANRGVDRINGYDYPQLISKFLMGAVFYNQAVDIYLDENLNADKKPNNKPYSKGAPYTGKEHSWDEAFGYFGFPAHGLTLTASQLYDINKQKESAVALADANRDGKVDLYREMVFAPAYYAAGYDLSNKTGYARAIASAFLDGRKLIASAKGAALSDTQRATLGKHAAIIETNWEKSLAESVFKYAGEVFEDLTKIETIIEAQGKPDKAFRKYLAHWGELKGFSLALQTGRKNLGETAVRLNRLIGFGPPLLNTSQVVDIDSKGNYVKGESVSRKEYLVHMMKVQKLMVDEFGIKARNHDKLAGLDAMLKKTGSGASAEND